MLSVPRIYNRLGMELFTLYYIIGSCFFFFFFACSCAALVTQRIRIEYLYGYYTENNALHPEQCLHVTACKNDNAVVPP